MEKIALIPARYASSRFPGKLMQKLGQKTVILQTYEATVKTELFDSVAVITDSEVIYREIRNNHGIAFLSNRNYECGTDRIAASLIHFPNAEIIINVQGDEPFTQKKALQSLLQTFEKDKNLQVASLMHIIKNRETIENSNNVKVVVDKEDFALLFSRSVIPFLRDKSSQITYYKHIGIYGFRRTMLLEFPKIPIKPLENAEKLEGLRYLENGIKLKMVLTDDGVIGIDTPEDLIQAQKFIST